MWGRYVTGSDRPRWAEWFEILDLAAPPLPTDPLQRAMREVLVARMGPESQPAHTAEAQWGLVPGFAKSPRDGGKMINLRAETITRTMGRYFDTRRCVFPAESWFISGAKKAGRGDILARSARPFGLAGIWTTHAQTGLQSCAMLTTAANARITEIHDRMPVMLDAAGVRAWLDTETSRADLRALTRPWPDDDTVLSEARS